MSDGRTTANFQRSQIALATVDAEVQRIIDDPNTSHWLREALLACLRRDALDAFNDVMALKSILELRLNAVLEAAKRQPRSVD